MKKKRRLAFLTKDRKNLKIAAEADSKWMTNYLKNNEVIENGLEIVELNLKIKG